MSILHFRSLNYINNIISMVMNQETIVSLHKKGERIRPSQKSFKFGVKQFESGQEVQGDRPDIQSTGPGQKENS